MNKKLGKWLVLAILTSQSGIVNAQFNTIRKSDKIGYEILTVSKDNISHTDNQPIEKLDKDSIRIDRIIENEMTVNPNSFEKVTVSKNQLGNRGSVYKEERKINNLNELLPLTIPNLLAEIRKNGIRHEKIVLAQAILETGWFRSSVCRNKNNLFGLTNPRTGQYYEFRHWTESVKAYYTKVQYRFKGEENYLLWLDRIGYAEDPRYISSLIKILKQYML